MNDNNISTNHKNNANPNDIQRIILTIRNKTAVIYCRVSSYGQTGQYHISFEVQEQKGNICANIFRLKVMSTVKVVESAYKGVKCTIKSLIRQNRGKNIIIYNVSRFCRNKDKGLELLDYAISCNTRLFFVEEGIVWDRNNQNNRKVIKNKLILAEEESKAIGRRVKDALQEKKRRGYFTGGTPKYGYKVVQEELGKRAVPEPYEQKIIKFINMCKTVGTTVRSLNDQMRQISDNFDEPIELYYNDKPAKTIKEPLTHVDIANLLNSYGISRRGTKWNGSNVGALANKDYEIVLEGMANMGNNDNNIYQTGFGFGC